MLHHYNYSTSLSHFLNQHHQQQQLSTTTSEQQQHHGNESEAKSPSLCDELSQEESELRCRSNSSENNNNKSFTIAAILGLKNNESDLDKSSADLSLVNFSVHHQSVTDHSLVTSRLQFPLVSHHSHSHNHHRNALGTIHYPVSTTSGHGCAPTSRQTIRGLKHISSSNVLPTGPSTGGGIGSNNNSNKKNCKSKRVRTIFTPEQLERLEAEFERQQYMVGPERLYLAHTLQLTEAQVKVWFQNRRIKWRKHHLELTHQRLAVLKQQQLLLDEAQQQEQDEDVQKQENNSSSNDNT